MVAVIASNFIGDELKKIKYKKYIDLSRQQQYK